MSGAEKENAPRLEQEGVQENNGGDRDPCKVPAVIPGIDGAGDGNCLLPSKDAVRAALRLIHPEGPWHVSAKREKGFTGKVYAPDAEGGAAGWAVAKNSTLNAYVSIAALRPGWNGDKATKEDVGSVGWLWVDVDPRPGEELEPERARILALLTTNLPKGVPPPSAIIDSGRGFWGLWHLARPVVMPPADDPAWDAARASVEDRNRGLELAFGADRCHNMERVMRLPGTVNRKPGGRLARVVQADASVFDLTTFPAVTDPKAGAAVAVTRIKEFADEIAEPIEPLGIVVTKYRAQSTIHQNGIRRLREEATAKKGPQVFEAVVPEANAVAAAAELDQHGRTIKQKYGPTAEIYRSLAADILAKLEA